MCVQVQSFRIKGDQLTRATSYGAWLIIQQTKSGTYSDLIVTLLAYNNLK